MDGRNNEIQNQSLQQADLIDQLSNENEEIMSLRFKNEKMRNDLNSKKQLNERIMKSQVDMDQLNLQNEQNLYRQKGKARIGYKEEG